MFKFPVVRMQEPSTPSWAHTTDQRATGEWAEAADAKSRSVWDWMHGGPLTPPPAAAPGAAVAELLARLRTPEQPARWDAVFGLGQLGAAVVGSLLSELRSEAAARARGFDPERPGFDPERLFLP
jgi:hypothetical protein